MLENESPTDAEDPEFAEEQFRAGLSSTCKRKDCGSMEEVHGCNERKRTGKGKGSADADSILKKQVVTVQRYTSELTGKLQKYARMGPQEFVPFEYDMLTINNIRKAYKIHFSSRIQCDMLCDILAGERGPSCKSFEQIPDLKVVQVVHIRFIEQEADTYTTADDHDLSPRTTSRFKNPSIDHTGPPPSPPPPPQEKNQACQRQQGFSRS